MPKTFDKNFALLNSITNSEKQNLKYFQELDLKLYMSSYEYNPFDYRDERNVEEEFISEYEPLDYNYEIDIWDLNNED